ncbi:unnamed protein product [Candida verbasci]|uniref:Uncharacterized protein n=1 Tax=Candida verbasci TaxID=1227364 RepID=A0A9W4XLS9_9ASCO|nr:unnamed protein product [Candida verbasci]
MDEKSITSTAKKKKKLIYRQDPDGVFRLKKIDDNDYSSTNKTLDKDGIINKKENINNYLNELINCSYQIIKDSTNNETASIQSSVDDSIRSGKKIRPTSNYTSSKNLNLITPPTTAESINQYSDIHSHHQLPSKSPTISIKSLDQESIKSQDKKNNNKFKNLMITLMNKASSFHAPSFLIGILFGIISCTTIFIYKEFFIKLTIILVVLGLVGGIIGLIALSIFIYFNLFNVRSIGIINNVLSKFIKAENIPNQVSDATSLNSNESYGDQSIKFEMSEIPQQQEVRDKRYHQPIDQPQQPKLQKRRSSNIRVTPYRFERGSKPSSSHHHESSPNLLNNPQFYAKQQPKIQRASSEPVSKNKNILKPKSRSNSTENSFKDLPTLPAQAEELPFINEVKLLDSFDQEIENIIPLQQNQYNKNNDMISRNLSKKSVLNTRENYKKFLANVDD